MGLGYFADAKTMCYPVYCELIFIKTRQSVAVQHDVASKLNLYGINITTYAFVSKVRNPIILTRTIVELLTGFASFRDQVTAVLDGFGFFTGVDGVSTMKYQDQ